VLLIPGDGGNPLEAKLTNRENTPHWFCSKNSDWFTLWLDVRQLLPLKVDCWAENIRIIYDQNL
jgi:lysophospholipase-3